VDSAAAVVAQAPVLAVWAGPGLAAGRRTR
jgi:hypothetical protein